MYNNAYKLKLFIFAGTIALLSAALPSQIFAKNPPAPQYINITPSPGAGMALNSEGVPDGQGAIQINIPVAYTPGKGYVDIGSFVGQWENISVDNGRKAWGNGSGFIGMGFGIKPRVYISAMAVSSILFKDSKSMNLQLQVLEETANFPAFAIGAQDIANKEKRLAPIATVGVGYYAIMTKSYSWKERPLYATAGYGTARFMDSPIGGLSYSMSDSFSAALEYDGFQLNEAIAWRPYGRFSRMTLTAGYNGKCGALIGIHFTGKLDNAWGLAIATTFLRRWY